MIANIVNIMHTTEQCTTQLNWLQSSLGLCRSEMCMMTNNYTATSNTLIGFS